MSKNIDQVFISNPITVNAGTDLMYFGQSPYGAGNDAAMTYANFAAQFGAPFTPSALTRTNDTNVTLTLGGTPNTALLQAVSLTMGWTGQLAVSRGGTGAATLTGLLTGNGTSAFTATAITQFNVLTAGASNAPNSVPPSATSGVPLISQGSSSQPIFGTAVVAGGGTGATSFTAFTVLCGGTTTTGPVQNVVSVGTSGQVLVSNGASQLPTFQTVAAGITNVNQTTGSATLAPNTRYSTNNGASLVTYTLPTSPTIGDTYIIVGQSSGGWTVAQNASQQIHINTSATTSGVTGSISSSNQYDCLTITNSGTNIFTAYAIQGNLTVV